MFGDRLKAGQWTLTPLIGVRIPVPEPSFAKATEWQVFCQGYDWLPFQVAGMVFRSFSVGYPAPEPSFVKESEWF